MWCPALHTIQGQVAHDVEVAGPTPVGGIPLLLLYKSDVAELMECLVHCPPCASAHSCDSFPRWPTAVGNLALVPEQAAIDRKGSWSQLEVENPVAHHEEAVSFSHALTLLSKTGMFENAFSNFIITSIAFSSTVLYNVV